MYTNPVGDSGLHHLIVSYGGATKFWSGMIVRLVPWTHAKFPSERRETWSMQLRSRRSFLLARSNLNQIIVSVLILLFYVDQIPTAISVLSCADRVRD